MTSQRTLFGDLDESTASSRGRHARRSQSQANGGGLDDPRGQLALRLLDLLEWTRPRWLVWENVPGVLSSGGGRDFGTFLKALAERGYGWAYRVLDAQFFGVPQRRRRVFVVGYLGDWRRAAAVLFERRGLPRNIETGSEAKPNIAGTITAGAGRRRGVGINPSEIVAALTACGVGTCGADDNQAQAGHIVAALTTTPYADRAAEESQLIVTHTLRGEGFDASEDGTGRGTPLVPVYAIQEGAVRENINIGPQGKGYQERIAYTLEARHHVQAVAYRVGGDGDVWESGQRVAALTTGTDPNSHVLAYQCHGSNVGPMGTLRSGNGNESGGVPFVCGTLNASMGKGKNGQDVAALVPVSFSENQRGELRTSEVHPALGGGGGKPGQGYPAALVQRAVRRLTPRECERLQGFPDDYTLVTHRKKPAADGPRYKAIGNSIAIPVLRWIGQGLLEVDGVA